MIEKLLVSRTENMLLSLDFPLGLSRLNVVVDQPDVCCVGGVGQTENPCVVRKNE